MPASRSRTTRWRECLDQIHRRGGPIEISIATDGDGAERAKSLIWRVRLLRIDDDALVVEQPVTLRTPIELDKGTALIGAMSIGQNRWMFHTRILGRAGVEFRPGRTCRALRLALPERVERCQRRNFYRISTAELSLPEVTCWPILDRETIIAAEVANRAQINQGGPGGEGNPIGPMVLPEVGPDFRARLVNLGGGGAGLVVAPGEAPSLDRIRLFWLAVDLSPMVRAPLGVTARLAHYRLDSAQNAYLGMAFDFTFNPSHERVVVQQVEAYVSELQRRISERSSAA